MLSSLICFLSHMLPSIWQEWLRVGMEWLLEWSRQHTRPGLAPRLDWGAGNRKPARQKASDKAPSKAHSPSSSLSSTPPIPLPFQSPQPAQQAGTAQICLWTLMPEERQPHWKQGVLCMKQSGKGRRKLKRKGGGGVHLEEEGRRKRK